MQDLTEITKLIIKRLKAERGEQWAADFSENFRLVKFDGSRFVFAYSDKSAYEIFMSDGINPLRTAAAAACGKMPDIRFKYEPKKAKKRAVSSKPAVPIFDSEFDTEVRRVNYKKGIKSIIASFICIVLAFLIAVVGINYFANRKFKENFYSLSLKNTFDNFRIIQLSDLHNSTYGKNNKELTDRISRLAPDIIVMTGDCLDKNGSEDEITELCTALAAVAPTYYIYGNNEWQRSFDCGETLEDIDGLTGGSDGGRDANKLYSADKGLKNALEKTGVKVLFNSSDIIEIGNNRVKIFGTLTSNPSAFWPYAGDEFYKFVSEDTDCVKLFLCHEPLLFETLYEDFWGDLVLCGDTHGGVVRLPALGALYSRDFGLLPERADHFIYGKYKAGTSDLIVSSGLSNKGFPRVFNQPELVIIDVNKY